MEIRYIKKSEKNVNDEELLKEHKKFLEQIEQFKLEDKHGLSMNEAKAIIISNNRELFESVASAFKLGFLKGQASLKENKKSI